MRVAHIEAGKHAFGGAAQVRYLVDGLAAARVDNVLICDRGGALAECRAQADVLPLPMHGDLDFGLVGRLRRTLRALKPDVVHVHSRRGAELFGGRACEQLAVPAVVTRRVDSRDGAVWTRLKYRPYRAVIAISRAIEAQLERSGVEHARIHRIPSAVDSERYRPDQEARARLLAAFGLPDDALIVAVVAQLIERKGHACLFAELPELVRAYPTLNVLCFGRGPLEHKLRAHVARARLERHVHFAGFRDDVPQLLPGVDVLAHPASREGLGVALLEALSCGVPIVACSVGGVVDVVEDGVHGRLVAAGNGRELREALAALLEDGTARSRLGAAGRAHVQRNFTIASMIAAHLKVYADAAV
jgi:glycosyltransferase involved in cell wall biosynthesis